MEGECGSVVVDQKTHDVYGHIVGSNPMEHAYVVPFKHIIEDIKFMFATTDVSLLEPTKLAQPYAQIQDLDIHPPVLDLKSLIPNPARASKLSREQKKASWEIRTF